MVHVPVGLIVALVEWSRDSPQRTVGCFVASIVGNVVFWPLVWYFTH